MRKVYISSNAYDEVKNYISGSFGEIEELRAQDRVRGAVSAHPDIYMCRDEARNTVIFGDPDKLGGEYPESIRYCAVILEKYFIHNTKYTAPELISYAEKTGLEIIDVRQGYTKCSCCIVDGKSIITSDNGICKRIFDRPEIDIDVLKISPGHILLPGHEYGFIGGCCGRLGDEIVFCGDIDRHPDGYWIRRFIEDRGLKIKSFPQLPLLDVGSIIPE